MDPAKEKHQVLRKSRKKCDENLGNKQTSVRERKHDPYMESSNLPKSKNARQVRRNFMSMLIIFFEINVTVHKEFVRAGQIVDSAYYCDVLRRLRENVRRLRLEHWQQKNCLLHRDNVTFHTSFFRGNF
jgi:hypothetical protein